MDKHEERAKTFTAHLDENCLHTWCGSDNGDYRQNKSECEKCCSELTAFLAAQFREVEQEAQEKSASIFGRALSAVVPSGSDAALSAMSWKSRADKLEVQLAAECGKHGATLAVYALAKEKLAAQAQEIEQQKRLLTEAASGEARKNLEEQLKAERAQKQMIREAQQAAHELVRVETEARKRAEERLALRLVELREEVRRADAAEAQLQAAQAGQEALQYALQAERDTHARTIADLNEAHAVIAGENGWHRDTPCVEVRKRVEQERDGWLAQCSAEMAAKLRAEAQLKRLRALHQPVMLPNGNPYVDIARQKHCASCRTWWPCETAALLADQPEEKR